MKTTVVGLTGPTGAGKGRIAEIFAAYGAKIIDADRVARDIVMPGSAALAELAAEFSQQIINSDGSLNRTELAKRAFASKSAEQRLNEITHPHIMKKIEAEIDRLLRLGEAMIILDAPLLFESGGEKLCDTVVCVVAPADIRRARIMRRDSISAERAEERMSAQPDDEFYTNRSNYVIVNDGDEQSLRKAAQEVIQSIRGE